MDDMTGDASVHGQGCRDTAGMIQPRAATDDMLRWRQVFQGEECQLATLRRWLARLLPESPALDDVLSVATELASNAVLHTASRRGGWFAVEITWQASVVRVAVADQGGSAEPHVIDDPGGERGRGLLLVRGLSMRTGVLGDHRGRLVWADLACDDPAVAAWPARSDPYNASILEGEVLLARRFAGVPAWFGRSTLAWWALAAHGDLVTAPTAWELAGLLYRMLETKQPAKMASRDNARRLGPEPDRQPHGHRSQDDWDVGPPRAAGRTDPALRWPRWERGAEAGQR
jgi:anti-sigma regulatory factor (Ser/Thr protein kinase)